MILLPTIPTAPKPINPLEGIALPSYPQVPKAPYVFDRPVKRYYDQPESLISNYNDPFEVNSMADVILTTFNPAMKRNTSLLGLEKIPILNIIPETVGLIYKTTVKPMLSESSYSGGAGLFDDVTIPGTDYQPFKMIPNLGQTIVINNLINLGETFDVVANPTKAFLFGEGLEGMQDAMGWGENGRVNHDWHTGNLAKDVAYELLSDPINWLTLFTKGAIVQLAKAPLRGIIKEGAGDLATQFAKEVGEKAVTKVYNRLAGKAVSAYLRGDQATMTASMTALAESMAVKNGWIFKQPLLPQDFASAMQKTMELAKESKTLKILDSLQTIVKPAEKLQAGMLKASLVGSGLYPTVKGIQLLSNWRTEYTQNVWKNTFDKFTKFDGTLDPTLFREINEAVDDRIATETILSGKSNLSKEAIAVKVRQTALHDSDTLSKLYGEEGSKDIVGWKTAQELEGQINNYFKTKYGVESFEQYITKLEDVNKNVEGQLDDILKHYQDEHDYFKQLLKNVEKNEVKTVFQDQTKVLEDTFKTHISANIKMVEDATRKLQVSYAVALKNPEVLDIAHKNIIQDYKDIMIDFHVNVDPKRFIRENLNVYQGPYKADMFKLEETLYNDMQKLYTEVYETQMRRIPYVVELYKQGVNNAFNIFPNHAVVELQNQFNAILRAYEKRQAHVLEGIVPLDRDIKFYSNVDKLLESTQSISKLLNNLFNTETRILSKEIKQLHIEPDLIRQAQEAVLKTFTDKPEQWLHLQRGLYRISPEQFKHTIEDFLAVDPQDIGAYTAAHSELTRMLSTKGMTDIQAIREFQRVDDVLLGKNDLAQYTDFRSQLYYLMNPEYDAKAVPEFTVLGTQVKELLQRFAKLEPATDWKTIKILRKRLFELAGSNYQLTRFLNRAGFGKNGIPGHPTTLSTIFKNIDRSFAKRSEWIAGDGQKLVDRFTDPNKVILEHNKSTVLATEDAAVSDLYNLLKSDALDPVRIEEAKLVIGAKGNLLQFKQELLIAALALVGNKPINEVMSEILLNVGDIGKYINNLALAQVENTMTSLMQMQSIAQELVTAAQKYKTYSDFTRQLFREHVGDANRLAFLSTIQKYAKIHPVTFNRSFNYHFSEIIKSAEDYMYTSQMNKSLSLDSYRMNDKQLMEWLREKLGSNMQAHDPVTDIWTLEGILLKELGSELDTTLKYFLLDIETTGLKDGGSSILSFASKMIGDDSSVLTRKLKIKDSELEYHLPQDQALKVFFPEADYGTYASRVEAFYKLYKDGDLDEFTMLTELHGQFKKMYLSPERNQFRIVAHNGDRFDFDFIRAKLNKYDIGSYELDQLEKLDSLKLLKKKHGIKGFTTLEEQSLKRVFRKYSDDVVKTGAVKLLNPIDGEVAEKFIALGSMDTKHLMVGNVSLQTQVPHLTNIGDDINEILNNISSVNKSLKRVSIDNQFIASQEGKQYLTEYLTKELKWSLAEVEEKFGLVRRPRTEAEMLELTSTYRNELEGIRYELEHGTISQTRRDHLMYRERQIHKVLFDDRHVYDGVMNMNKLMLRLNPEGISMFGYKNDIKFGSLAEWTSLKVNQEVPAVLTERLSTLTNRLQRTYDAIKDPAPLMGLEAQIQKSLAKFAFVKEQLPNDLLQYLNFGKQDVRSNWVMLEYLYKQLTRYEEGLQGIKKLDDTMDWNAFIKTQLDPQVLELLEDPTRLYLKDINYKYEIKSDFARPKELREARNKFFNEHQDLKELSLFQDLKQVFRPKTQATSAAIMPMYTLLETVMKRVSTRAGRKLFQKADLAYHDYLVKNQLHDILSLDSKTLRDLMVHDAEFIRFDYSDLIHNDLLLNKINELIGRKSELKDLGVTLTQKDNHIILNLNLKKFAKGHFYEDGVPRITFNGDIIERPILRSLNIKKADELYQHVKDGTRQLDTDFLTDLHKVHTSMDFLSESESAGSLGDLIIPAQIKEMYNLLPNSVQKELGAVDMLLKDAYHSKVRFNFMNLGTIESRKMFQPYAKGSMVQIYNESMQDVIVRAKTKLQYAMTYFDNASSINTGKIKDFTNKEILQMFKANPDYNLVALVDDNKGGFKLINIELLNEKSVALARKLDAQIMSYHTYATANAAINQKQWGSILSSWQNIMFLFKIGWLTNPGSWMRNYVDSTGKTAIDTFSNPLKVIGLQFKAYGMLRNYGKSVKEVVQMDIDQQIKHMIASGEMQAVREHTGRLLNKYNLSMDEIEKLDIHGRFTSKSMEDYFNTPGLNPKLDRESFEFVHNYVVDGPSAGMVGTPWDKYFFDANIDKLSAWQTTQHKLGKLLLPHQYIEQINRLTEYIILHEAGYSTSRAFKQIADTHFDYKTMTELERHAELIFPFYTYFTRNTDYWIRAVQDKPWLGTFLSDVYTPIWDFDGIDHDELSRNMSLQYQIMSGNIPIYKNMTLKLSPSFLDALSILSSPVTAMSGRLAQPLKVLFADPILNSDKSFIAGLMKGILGLPNTNNDTVDKFFLDLVPIISTVYQRYFEQGPEYFARTGELLNLILPDVFGATKRWETYSKHGGKGTTLGPKRFKARKPRKPRWVGKPRKTWGKRFVKKSFAKKKYGKKIWAKKVYNKNIYAKPTYATKVWSKNVYAPNFEHQKVQYESFYKGHYSSAGNSKMRMRTAPTTAGSLKFKLKDMQYHSRLLNQFRR